jgi:hypothetical protein
LVSLAPGCKKGSSPSSPDAGGDARRSDDPLAELDALEQQMRGMGLAVSSKRDSTTTLSEKAERAEETTLAEDDAAPDFGADGDATVAPAPEAYAGEAERVESEATADEPSEARGRRAQQCSNVCDLSVAICDLEVRICSLSESHRGEPTYADACRRAGDDCEVAGHECDRCD